jgi:hypothetical protein
VLEQDEAMEGGVVVVFEVVFEVPPTRAGRLAVERWERRVSIVSPPP